MPASATPKFSKPKGTIEKPAMKFEARASAHSVNDESVPTWGHHAHDWEDVGAFVLHCTNEILDDIIKNHHEVFNSRPVPEAQGSSSSNRNRFSFKLPERSFQIEGSCIFRMVEAMFYLRTSYLRNYSRHWKLISDKILRRSDLPEIFNEILEKIDKISAKAFPQPRRSDLGRDESLQKHMELITYFRRKFLAHLFGKLEEPIPEQSHIILTDSSNEMKTIFARLAGLVYWHFTPRFAEERRARVLEEREIERTSSGLKDASTWFEPETRLFADVCQPEVLKMVLGD